MVVFYYIWARLVARLKANHPSPVLNDCGFAVWASRMIPNPSLNGSKSTMRSYLTRNFFLGPGEVDVLGGEAQEAGVLMDGLLVLGLSDILKSRLGY